MNYTQIGEVAWTRQDLINKLDKFAGIYEKRPINNNFGGMGIVHMFYTWFLCQQLSPKFVIESGIWMGQSSWLLELACPNAKIISIDPELFRRQYISNKIEYTTTDFSMLNWDHFDKDATLCFFDDHYGADRILQAYLLGFTHILYEDNYHDTRGNTNHPDGNAFSPKAALLQNHPDVNLLKMIMKIYYEFPPIYSNVDSSRGYKWAKISRENYLNITPPPLLTKECPKLKIYDKDDGYTWMAYIKLGK